VTGQYLRDGTERYRNTGNNVPVTSDCQGSFPGRTRTGANKKDFAMRARYLLIPALLASAAGVAVFASQDPGDALPAPPPPPDLLSGPSMRNSVTPCRIQLTSSLLMRLIA